MSLPECEFREQTFLPLFHCRLSPQAAGEVHFSIEDAPCERCAAEWQPAGQVVERIADWTQSRLAGHPEGQGGSAIAEEPEPWVDCFHKGKRVGKRGCKCEFECLHPNRGGTATIDECRACPPTLYEPI